jgi:hypothetical protein
MEFLKSSGKLNGPLNILRIGYIKENFAMKSLSLKLGVCSILFSSLSLLAACGGGGSASTGAASTGSTTGASVRLSWIKPTTNTDGSALTDLAGFYIKYGTSSGNYSSSVDAGNSTSYEVQLPTSSKYYLTVVAYDSYGNESIPSNEVTN